jgi:hypothetical protein
MTLLDWFPLLFRGIAGRFTQMNTDRFKYKEKNNQRQSAYICG